MSHSSLLDKGNTEVIDPDTYFETHKPPNSLPEDARRLEEFVKLHEREGRNLVLVTSGGTTVPLENQTVRFIDNFSAGTRGATSAEYFLDAGYAVIFMHRQFSLQPYSRHYSHTTNCFLDFMEFNDDGTIGVNAKFVPKMKQVLHKYQEAKRKNTLLFVDFVTVTDYLFLLRTVTQCMARLKERALYYLAAAVSDFFIPQQKMTEHKIQSSEGGLTLTMDQVPKFLKPMVAYWAPQGFIASFKLETDSSLLVSKSRHALTRYGHQIVIANLLQTRKREVWLITNESETELRLTDDEVQRDIDIESKIVLELANRHNEWIALTKTKAAADA